MGKLVAAAVTAARFVRPAGPRSRWAPLARSRRSLVAIIRPAPRRSRRRFALLAIAIAMLAGWAVLRNPASRSRIDRAVSDARRRFDGMRARPSDGIDHEAGEPAPATTSDVAPAGGDGTAAAMDPIDAGSTAAAANPA